LIKKQQHFLEKKRNKLFTNWMKMTSESMNKKIYEAHLAQDYIMKMKKKVLEVLRVNFIKKKRENIMM
jgi:hypothetical protein